MLDFKQPPTLVSCALNSLLELVQFANGSLQLDTNSYAILRDYVLSIPNNLFDQWAEKLLLSASRSQIKSDAHFLVFSPALTRLNIDNFPALPVNIHALCNSFQYAVNLKQLCCRYAPFFWSPSDLLLFQNSIMHLQNLQKLTLCNIDLTDSPTFLETVGTSCKKIKELDISYGKIPVTSTKVICENFSTLEVLKLKQHSEKFRTTTLKDIMKILTCLLRLKILDDDTTAWSCVLPAFQQLSNEMYSDLYACIQQLTIYECSATDVNLKFTKLIQNVCLDSKVFQKSPDKNIAHWLRNNFPGLISIDLRLENVWFSTIERFIQTENIGWKIRSIRLSKIPLNLENFQMIGKYAINLKDFEIINQRTLDVVIYDRHIDPFEDRLITPLFCNLRQLSFTGVVDERIASLLLDHSVCLQELQLRTNILPMQFLDHNPLHHLRRLVLDMSHTSQSSTLFVYDLEMEFLRRILQSASHSLRELCLKSRPLNEWNSLCQQLKTANCDLEILRPII